MTTDVRDEAGNSSPSSSGRGGKRRLALGICCMASKACSSPMQAILRRLEICGDFDVALFPEDTILGKPAREWPVVECLIAFVSSGFPLEKCVEYCKLRNPKCINNVEAQASLCSRAAVYRILTEWCIPCPEYIIVDHSRVFPNGRDELAENENYIIFNGRKISKPFVEKPEDGNRHDIWIYYPRSIGGGAKKLFRKVKDKSSEFDPNQNKIRRDGVYIYEPFLPTQGTDIKVYTVGAGYVHAEARKAPTVDGKVQRSKDGKEVRYPVVLTQGEKAIAAFVVKAFRQNICGFDILRTDGGSYVCDVNGWSFVKGNQKYYNDCSTLIRKHLLDECGVCGVDTSTMMILGPGDEVIRDTGNELSQHDYATRQSLVNRSSERLRSVIVVMRHGERRPKEKMKFKTKHPAILSYFDKVDVGTAEVKLKTPEELEMLKGHMEGAVQDLRDQLAKALAAGAGDEGLSIEDRKQRDERLAELKQLLLNTELLIPVLEMRDRFSGLERKVQLKAVKWKQAKEGSTSRRAAQVLVVAKWGGELTVGGLAQAQELGRRLRHDLYPNDPTGLLRLHSSFRHDFKIYSSQEGRCQITAAAFTKGFLDLDGDLIPILVSLVTRDSFAQGLLDEPIPKKQRDAVKQKIESLLMSYTDMSSGEALKSSCPTAHAGLREAVRRIGSPLQLLHTIRYLAMEYIESISAAKERTHEEMKRHSSGDGDTQDDHDQDDGNDDDAVPLGDQVPQGPGPMIPFDLKDSYKRQWLHLRRKEHRWRKLIHGFIRLKDEDKGHADDNTSYDASKIPDVWDNLYYDMLTHRNYLGAESCRIAEMMVGLMHPLNEWVCLSEYGISEEEKMRIGIDVTWRLVGKILGDLEFMIEADGGGSLDEAGRQRLESGVNRSMPRVESTPSCRRVASDTLVVPPSSQAGQSLRTVSAPELASNRSGPAAAPDRGGPTGPEEAPSLWDLPAGSFERAVSGGASSIDELVRTASVPLPDSQRQWRELGMADSSRASDAVSKAPTPTGGDAASVRAEDGDPPNVEDGASVPSALPSQFSVERVESSASSFEKRRSKLARLTPEVRNELKQAMRDSSDWHPRLNDQVQQLTDIENTRIVRSRIYVTSASTMHSLFNILRHGQSASGGDQLVTNLDQVLDLNYLTHIVLRCYEREPEDDVGGGETQPAAGHCPGTAAQRPADREKARYFVEISMSPGVQVFWNGQQVTWPLGNEFREDTCTVAPLEIIAESVELSKIEHFLTEAIKEYGTGSNEDEEDDDRELSDNN